MSAAEALRAARTAGITVTLDGETLLLKATAEPPQAVLDALSRHKLAILDLLRPGQCGWTAEQWRAYFDKRYSLRHKKSAQNVRGDGHATRHEVAWYGCMFGFAVSTRPQRSISN